MRKAAESTSSIKLSSMGDINEENLNKDVPQNASAFFIGELEPRREMPQQLRDRLTEKKPSKVNSTEKEREREKRLNEMHEQKKQKLREHHEKVDRLVAEKQQRKQLQAADDIHAGSIDQIDTQGTVSSVEEKLEKTNQTNSHNCRAIA